MAFYSIRVDDEGKEIETSRQTFRKLENLQIDVQEHSPEKECRENLNGSSSTIPTNYKTVRYVNSATFIEKDLKAKKPPLPSSEDEQEAANSSDCSDTNSDDILDGQYQTHIAQDCDTIPLLELNSNESFPSSNNMTYSYRKVCEVTKMIQKPDAYREWVDAKRAAKLYEQRVKEEKIKSEEEKKRERKMLAEKKYQEWLARKSKSKVDVEQPTVDTVEQNLPQPIKKLTEEEQRDREKNFQAWLERKSRQQKFVKERLNEELKRERELERRRREEAEKVYNGWLKTAPQKPKPVPLNRGMFTLKGSVSNLYVNPVPWASSDGADSSVSL